LNGSVNGFVSQEALAQAPEQVACEPITYGS